MGQGDDAMPTVPYLLLLLSVMSDDMGRGYLLVGIYGQRRDSCSGDLLLSKVRSKFFLPTILFSVTELVFSILFPHLASKPSWMFALGRISLPPERTTVCL